MNLCNLDKKKMEFTMLGTWIIMQIIWVIYTLLCTKGTIYYPEYKVVDEVRFYSTKSYDCTNYLILSMMIVILVQVIVTVFGIIKNTYLATYAITLGIFLTLGVRLQMHYAAGASLYKYMVHMVLSFVAIIVVFLFVRRKISDRGFCVIKKVIIGLIFLNLFLIIFGVTLNGASNWLLLGGVSFQPGEFLKACIVILAAYCYKFRLEYRLKKTFFILVICSIGVLILSRDLGNAFILGAILVVSTYFLLDSLFKAFLVAISGLSVGAISIGILTLLGKGYILARFDMVGNAINNSNQLGQSLRGILQAGLRGMGDTAEVTSITHIYASSSDLAANTLLSIYGIPVLVLMISAVALLLFMLLFSRIYRTFNYMLMLLSISMIFVQVTVSILGNLNVIPFTGVTLPWISAGGSSMISIGILFGFILSGLCPKID